MSTVYDVKIEDAQTSEDSQLASVAFVKEVAKSIMDNLIAHANNVNTAHTPEYIDSVSDISYPQTTSKDLDVGLAELPTIKAIDIETDSTHQFISDTVLNILKSKPSNIDLSVAMDDVRNELKATINNTYEKLINTPDALQKLHDISYILQEDASLQTLMNLLASKATAEELATHMNSVYHLSSNDRKALNLLLRFIKEGCADWDADKDAPNYIRNKPSALPADGGNADTVKGYEIDSLLNRRHEDFIIGAEGYGYEESEVDSFVSSDSSNVNEAFALIPDGKTYLRAGVYILKSLILSGDSYTKYLIGDGSRTILNTKTIILNSNIYLRDFIIANSNVRIRSDCNLDNIQFANCNVIMDESTGSSIKNCTFDADCTFEWNGRCQNNILVYNRILATFSNWNYIGGGNIIKDNIGA